jgi:hypothetical protein
MNSFGLCLSVFIRGYSLLSFLIPLDKSAGYYKIQIDSSFLSPHAAVAELADARDLKSLDGQLSYRFDPGQRHQKKVGRLPAFFHDDSGSNKGAWGKGSPVLRGSARGGRPLREAKRVRSPVSGTTKSLSTSNNALFIRSKGRERTRQIPDSAGSCNQNILRFGWKRFQVAAFEVHQAFRHSLG